jgi:hypothetical protein
MMTTSSVLGQQMHLRQVLCRSSALRAPVARRTNFATRVKAVAAPMDLTTVEEPRPTFEVSKRSLTNMCTYPSATAGHSSRLLPFLWQITPEQPIRLPYPP